jgi:ribosomal protein S18 acetylase RimI-like enzyme
MTQAGQIAALLNDRNQLVVAYDADRILAHGDNYLFRTDDAGAVIACLEVKQVQWYQFEVSHVTVAPEHEGRGLARTLVEDAEKAAVKKRAGVLQCTIRDDNARSKGLFQRCGFSQVSTFYYPVSGNNVTVWQKVVSTAR